MTDINCRDFVLVQDYNGIKSLVPFKNIVEIADQNSFKAHDGVLFGSDYINGLHSNTLRDKSRFVARVLFGTSCRVVAIIDDELLGELQ